MFILRLVKTACTRFLKVPEPGQVAEVEDQTLYNHVLSITEALIVDAASNEVVSGLDCTVRLDGVDRQQVFSSCRFVLRDGTHCCRRVLSRPWGADPVIEKLIGMLVTWKGSLGQLIHHSEALRNMYQECTASAEAAVTSKFGNLRCAKHRFETHLTPLSRVVLGLDAFFMFAVRLAETRKGTDQGRSAETFLETITPGMLIVLGMLADAGTEAMALLRLMDQNIPDISSFCGEIELFLDRITYLFHQGGCQNINGHLRVVLAWLCEPHFFVYRNQTKTIGRKCAEGDWHGELRAAEVHLRAWTVLARQTIEAEFPDFSLLAAFSVFSLKGGGPTQEVKKKLERLAAAWQLDTFESEFREHRPIAEKMLAEDQGATVISAWREAIARGTKARRASNPTALVHVVQRLAAFTGSTSGIEHSFSKVEKLLSACRLNHKAELHTESGMIGLIIGGEDTRGKVQVLCDAARAVWKQVFPARVVRQHTGRRLDEGLSHVWQTDGGEAAATGKVSERTFRKRRRAQLDVVAGSVIACPTFPSSPLIPSAPHRYLS